MRGRAGVEDSIHSQLQQHSNILTVQSKCLKFKNLLNDTPFKQFFEFQGFSLLIEVLQSCEKGSLLTFSLECIEACEKLRIPLLHL